MFFKDDVFDENGNRFIGECDECGEALTRADDHWLILFPWKRKVELLCGGCRKWLRGRLADEADGREEDGRFSFVWDGHEHTIEEAEREVLYEQTDEDEVITYDLEG